MRVFGLISIVASLVGGLYLASTQMTSLAGGGTSPAATSAGNDAAIVAATFAARQAEAVLEEYHRQTGSYAGASLAGAANVTLLRADATSFCLLVRVSGRGLYDRGPGGDVGTEPCA